MGGVGGEPALFCVRRGAGTPVVLIHGAGGSHRHWGYVLGPLSRQARCLAVDLAGHGRSPGPSPDTLAGHVDALARLLDEEGIERALLMGHSLGGAIALALALARPERALGLALVGSGARLPLPEWLLPGLATRREATIARLAPLLFAPGAEAASTRAAERELLGLRPGLLEADYALCAALDLRPALASLRAPLLALCGDGDQLAPPALSAELADALPAGSASLRLIPGAGHMAPLEASAEVATVIVEFLDSSSSLAQPGTRN